MTRIPLILLIYFALFFGAAFAVQAQQEQVAEQIISDFGKTADALEQRLEQQNVRDQDIESQRSALEDSRRLLTALATAAQDARAPLAAELEALGPAPEDPATEAPEIAAERARLTAEIAEIETDLKRAQQEAARARGLLDRLNTLRRDRFTQRLLERDVTPLNPVQIFDAWDSIQRKATSIAAGMRTHMVVGSAYGSMIDRFALPVILSIIALILAVIVRRKIVQALFKYAHVGVSRTRTFVIGIAITAARLLMPIVALMIAYAGLSGSWFAVGDGEAIVRGLIRGAVILIAAYALGRAYYAPEAAHMRFSRLGDSEASTAHRALMALATFIALHRVLVVTGEEINLSIAALAVLNASILVLGGIALWHFVRVAGIGVVQDPADGADGDAEDPLPGEEVPTAPIEYVSRAIRYVALAAAVLAPLLALAGYYRASQYLFFPLIQSGALIGLCLLFYRVVREFSGITRLGRSGDTASEGGQSGLLPVLTGFLLSVAAAPLLALIWGAGPSDLIAFWNRVVEGFQVGEVRISPVDFLLFAIVLAIGFVATRLVQGVLRRSVLPLTRMDEGGKSAVLAGIGYLGIVIASLVAISSTGLDLSNVAIVAGALSVGIGFGLQNVVNNFVSGIILLIERPIKTGDWIEVGGIHGTVRNVNVRSTEIQTFDRSTMFVPNADLISGTVTNWTHGNTLGRIIVSVGVAYGTDARKVEAVLLEVAQAHPMLMKRPAPYVVFQGFGADSIDFEIRGVLRDVNWILNVGSDLRFAIYERFNKEGIEIPFAQRVLHVQNASELGAAVRGTPEPPLSRPVPRREGPDAGEGGEGDGEGSGGDGDGR